MKFLDRVQAISGELNRAATETEESTFLLFGADGKQCISSAQGDVDVMAEMIVNMLDDNDNLRLAMAIEMRRRQICR